MDEDECGGFGDHSEKFHRNEAISAVADEGFLAEEDDDYEDLYNDVNVSEGFLQSLRKNEDLGFRNEEVEKKPEPPPPHPQLTPQTAAESSALIPRVGGDGYVKRKFEKDVGVGGGESKVSGGVEGFQNAEFRGNETAVKSETPLPPDGSGMRVELGHSMGKVAELKEHALNNSVPNQGIARQHQAAGTGTVGNVANVGNAGTEGVVRQGGGNVNSSDGNAFGNGAGASTGFGAGGGGGGGGGSGSGGAGTILFVGDLHWWTTDAELEAELCKYGAVKEVKFFDEKASGKSKGYCQVEFYDLAAAAACKARMNGHVFNGRPCVVAFASPYSVKRMGEAQVNRSQQNSQAAVAQTRRSGVDAAGKTGSSNVATGGNYQGSGDNNRGYGRGNWGRGNAQGMGNRGPTGPMRNRPGGMVGRGIMGNGGNGFGQGIGAAPPLLPPMMGQGFDPTFGAPMGRLGGYGGFPGAPTPPFSGILSSFPPVGSVGLPGVAPHVNPAFFGRGMPMNGMGMMSAIGVEGHNMGMWSDPNISGWASEEHAGRAGESSYGEEATSDHQYREVSHDRGGWSNATKEKDRGSEREVSGSTERRHRDDRELGYGRDMPREKDTDHDHDRFERRRHDVRDVGRDRGREREHDRERSRDRDHDRYQDRDQHRDDGDRYTDHHRYRDREPEYDDDYERGRSSRTRSKSRLPQEEEQRSRSRDAEYGKRRRVTSE